MQNVKTRKLVESALMIALAMVLNTIKFGGLWAFGGGVTVCSMVPLVLISFRWGWKWGGFTAFVFSLLQMIQGIDNVQYATCFGMALAIILLDYVLAYSVIGFSGIFDHVIKNRRGAIALGTAVTVLIRFGCHFLSGWLIWDALWPNEFGWAGPYYSLIYNGSYMLPELIITVLVSVLLIPVLDDALPKTGRKKKETA